MAIGRLAPCVRIGRVSRFPPPREEEERSVRGILPLACVREREREFRGLDCANRMRDGWEWCSSCAVAGARRERRCG